MPARGGIGGGIAGIPRFFWAPQTPDIAPIIGYRLVGSDVTFTISVGGSVTLTADPGSYSVTGSTAAFVVTAPAAASSYTLTGSAAGFVIGTSMPAVAGSYAVTGATAAFVTTASVTAGSYNLTGSAATLTATSGTTLAADAGSYAVTGSSVALLRSPGYLITGSTAVFKTVMPADQSISGDTLSPTSAFFITTTPATAGSYSLTGSAVTFTTTGSVTMVASPGSYVVTGSDVTFLGGVAPPPDVTAPSPGGAGAGRRYGRYGKFRLKKKYRDELEELFDRIQDLPPPAAEAAPPLTGTTPSPSVSSLLDGVAAPVLTTLQPSASAQDEDDDEVALLLELLS